MLGYLICWKAIPWHVLEDSQQQVVQVRNFFCRYSAPLSLQAIITLTGVSGKPGRIQGNSVQQPLIRDKDESYWDFPSKTYLTEKRRKLCLGVWRSKTWTAVCISSALRSLERLPQSKSLRLCSGFGPNLSRNPHRRESSKSELVNNAISAIFKRDVEMDGVDSRYSR